MRKKYKCETDCAACAQKLEDALGKIKGITDVKINFMMQKIVVEAPDDIFESVLDDIAATARRISPDTKLHFEG